MKVEENTSGFLPSARRNKLFITPEIVDYVLGFLIGTAFSIFSFYLLGFFRNRKQKRAGMFWGCILSFMIIITLCVSFACYTSYVQHTRSQAGKLHGRKLVKLMSFGEYMKTSLHGLIPAKSAQPVAEKKGKTSAVRNRKLPGKPLKKKSKKRSANRKHKKAAHRSRAKRHQHVKRKSRSHHQVKRRNNRRKHHLVV